MPFELKPYNINISNGDHSSSTDESKTLFFSEEIQKCHKRIMENQSKQFNLGNNKKMADPMEAARYLLEREYGEIFDSEITEAIFIPPVFMSKEYDKDIPTLEDIDKIVTENCDYLMKHFPKHWLTFQLSSFLKNGEMKYIQGWIKKLKFLFILNSSCAEHPKSEFSPSWENSRGNINEFANKCINHLRNHSRALELVKEIQDAITTKTVTQWLEEKIKHYFTESVVLDISHEIILVLKYLFGLNYSDYRGETAERFFFETLQSNDRLLSDFVILHSLAIFTSPSTTGDHKEYDLFLISAERKMIIAVEIKHSKKQRNEAKKQLEKSKRMFEEKLGNQLDYECIFYPVIFIFEHFENISQPDHIVTSETVSNWLNELVTYRYPKKPEGDNLNKKSGGSGQKQLQNIMKVLLFCLYINKSSAPSTLSPGLLTTSKWVQWLQEVIETISTMDTIMFYSKEQLAILYGDHPKIIIEGGYGTGKTILLKEKAQMLARMNEKVLFLVHHSYPKSLLQLSLEKSFSEEEFYRRNIIVDNYLSLLPLMRKYEDAHIFIDELHLDVQLPSTMIVITQMIEKTRTSEKCLWIVFHRLSEFKDHEMFQDFKRTDQLVKCLRCTKSIVEAGKENNLVDQRTNVMVLESFENFPNSTEPIYVNDIKDAIDVCFKKGFFHREIDTSMNRYGIIYRVTGNPTSKEFKEHCERLWEECRHRNITIMSYSRYNKLETNDQVYLNHLHQKNSILMISNEDILEGFEWPVIIFDTRNNDGRSSSNEYFRSMVTYIGIKPSEENRSNIKLI